MEIIDAAGEIEKVEDVSAVVKSGDTGIRLFLSRSHLGLTLEVKLHPSVEDFMRNLSGGELVNTSINGRYWYPIDAHGKALNDPPPMMAYECDITDKLMTDEGKEVVLGRLCQPLVEYGSSVQQVPGTSRLQVSNTPAHDKINISFLRLVGASNGKGVKFGVRGVFSKSSIYKMRDDLGEACRKFYMEYLRAMDLNVYIMTGG